MSDIVLNIRNVRKSFTGVQVLHGLNFDLKKGEVLGLIGENGAGKSTLMNIIGGVLPMDSGSMELAGEPYAPRSPLVATEMGIAFIHQELNLFTNLTVAENLFIDCFPKNRVGAIDRKKMRRLSEVCMDRFSLPVTPDTKVRSLPTGIRQMVEISKGLMKNARIMIFDEPTTSLSRREKEDLFKTIDDLKDKGISIIYISHILEDVFRLCDRITVLRDGRIIETKATTEFSESELIKCMVGREMTQVFPSIEKEIQDTVLLDAKNIRCADKVKGVSLSLKAGEIVGLYGLMGAGRTDLAKVLFGVQPMDEGEVTLHSRKHSHLNPEVCIKQDVAFITEDRHHEGLLMTKSIDENLSLVKMSRLSNRIGVVDVKEKEKHNLKAIKDLKIKVSDYRHQLANSLSGGNQQKVVFGKWVMNDPKIFILDEPTRGVDVGAKFEIYSIIIDLAKSGSAVLFISSEIEELIGTCDRILVMKDGRVTGDIPKSEYDREKILQLALLGK
ncbi:MAG: sugar ABC transporter ATP-binding protein [Verrucomicrobia bacterium]|nr:sugar ABC transporter ATP-binding protein [Verrucomicrobiota bacterium]